VNDAIDEGIFWLVWVPAGLVLAAMWLIILSPLLVPYLVVRWIAGPERAERFAWAALALLAVAICAYQVVLWIADPLSFFLWRS
jgi:hypothetical protein